MYFNNNREDTNIDKEFNNRGFNIDFNKLKMPLMIIGGIVLLIVIILIISNVLGRKTNYFLTLEGNDEITIYEGTTYNELGYIAFDNKDNTYMDEVIIDGVVDTNSEGSYTITYNFKDIKKTRVVKVIPKASNITFVHLNGDMNITLNVGDTYTEPGYSAIDSVDGDLTSKVIVSGKVDTKKVGSYSLVYFVTNSNGVTTSSVRKITIK